MLRAIQLQNHPVYELTNGHSVARFAPQFGARLLNWQVDGREVIYWPKEIDWTRMAHVRGGNPILFPFIARHMVDGKIGFWLDATGTKRALPMHGFARDAAFSVIPDDDTNTLRMRILPTAQTREWYPFEFVFDVVYRIGDKTLEVALETTNSGSGPMPYYTGHHFYFAVPHDQREKWELRIPCERRGVQTPDGAIIETPAEASVFRLSDSTLSDKFQIGLKSNILSLRQTEAGTGVDFNLDAGGNVPWYAVTTWTEKPDSDFYCVEPWTGLPNAIHHGKGLRYLAPGAKESAVCVLKVI